MYLSKAVAEPFIDCVGNGSTLFCLWPLICGHQVLLPTSIISVQASCHLCLGPAVANVWSTQLKEGFKNQNLSFLNTIPVLVTGKYFLCSGSRLFRIQMPGSGSSQTGTRNLDFIRFAAKG